MERYNIYAGMGGSFGGANYQMTGEFASKEEAEKEAYECACDIYSSYEGINGILNWDECAADYCELYGIASLEELTEEDNENISELYDEEREGWIVYFAVLESDDPKHDKNEG